MAVTAPTAVPAAVFGAGLDGDLVLEYADGHRQVLPVGRWTGGCCGADLSLVQRCAGPTLDVGCGPGRLLVALGERGIPALGVDVTRAAVGRALARGGLVLPRSVFATLPGTGRWATALLADGNVGIGGDPQRLLTRVRALLARGGRVLVELDPPGSRSGRVVVRLRSGSERSEWFGWAHVVPGQVDGLAAAAGLNADEQWEVDGRWFAALTRP